MNYWEPKRVFLTSFQASIFNQGWRMAVSASWLWTGLKAWKTAGSFRRSCEFRAWKGHFDTNSFGLVDIGGKMISIWWLEWLGYCNMFLILEVITYCKAPEIQHKWRFALETLISEFPKSKGVGLATTSWVLVASCQTAWARSFLFLQVYQEIVGVEFVEIILASFIRHKDA